MTRREMLVAMLQALFLALFPWLRTESGIEVAARAAEEMVPAALDYGLWSQAAMWHLARGYNLRWTNEAPFTRETGT